MAVIVAHAYATVPFYRETMRRRSLEPSDFVTAADLAKLPLIDAATVQEDPERFTSCLHGPGRRWGFHTSGSSTGVRRIVYRDTRSLLLEAACDAGRAGVVISRLAGERWAGTVLRALAGDRRPAGITRLLGRALPAADEHQRISIFPAEPSSRSERALRSEQTLVPRRTGHRHDLSPGITFEHAADELRRLHPRVVFSFGSYADQFFRYLDEFDISLPLPRVWAYTGDMVSPTTSAQASARNCRLYSIYATTEAGQLGFQCELLQGLHLNIDHCAVRVADEEGRTVPPGEPGELIVSNFDNRAMVLLNFRIGDRAVLSGEPCRCGRNLPVLERLDGRSSETIVLGDGRRMSALTVEGLFARQLRQTRQVQLTQSAPGELYWSIVPFGGVDRDQLRRAVLDRGDEVLGAQTHTSVSFVEHIPATAQHKFLRGLSGNESERRKRI